MECKGKQVKEGTGEKWVVYEDQNCVLECEGG